jgi:hypothetical protein
MNFTISFFEWLVLQAHGKFIGANRIEIISHPHAPLAFPNDSLVFFFRDEKQLERMPIPSVDFQTLQIIHSEYCHKLFYAYERSESEEKQPT